MRLQDYDYSEEGAYFVTICTRNRECILSKIDSDVVGAGLAPALNGEASESIISLTKEGEIIKKNWLEIPARYAHVYIDEYVIMPNHLHGILLFSSDSSGTTARVTPTLGRIIGENNMEVSGKIWQRNYYEHVIRNEDELNMTREYIQLNPYKWADDEENPDHTLF
jgi:REP element-mobilizing transposase RayT